MIRGNKKDSKVSIRKKIQTFENTEMFKRPKKTIMENHDTHSNYNKII